MSTKFPIRDSVMMVCPKCHAYVWCERAVYPEITYYTCHPHNHHFEWVPVEGESDPGEKPKGVTGEHPERFDKEEQEWYETEDEDFRKRRQAKKKRGKK